MTNEKTEFEEFVSEVKNFKWSTFFLPVMTEIKFDKAQDGIFLSDTISKENTQLQTKPLEEWQKNDAMIREILHKLTSLSPTDRKQLLEIKVNSPDSSETQNSIAEIIHARLLRPDSQAVISETDLGNYPPDIREDIDILSKRYKSVMDLNFSEIKNDYYQQEFIHKLLTLEKSQQLEILIKQSRNRENIVTLNSACSNSQNADIKNNVNYQATLDLLDADKIFCLGACQKGNFSSLTPNSQLSVITGLLKLSDSERIEMLNQQYKNNDPTNLDSLNLKLKIISLQSDNDSLKNDKNYEALLKDVSQVLKTPMLYQRNFSEIKDDKDKQQFVRGLLNTIGNNMRYQDIINDQFQKNPANVAALENALKESTFSNSAAQKQCLGYANTITTIISTLHKKDYVFLSFKERQNFVQGLFALNDENQLKVLNGQSVRAISDIVENKLFLGRPNSKQVLNNISTVLKNFQEDNKNLPLEQDSDIVDSKEREKNLKIEILSLISEIVTKFEKDEKSENSQLPEMPNKPVDRNPNAERPLPTPPLQDQQQTSGINSEIPDKAAAENQKLSSTEQEQSSELDEFLNTPIDENNFDEINLDIPSSEETVKVNKSKTSDYLASFEDNDKPSSEGTEKLNSDNQSASLEKATENQELSSTEQKRISTGLHKNSALGRAFVTSTSASQNGESVPKANNDDSSNSPSIPPTNTDLDKKNSAKLEYLVDLIKKLDDPKLRKGTVKGLFNKDFGGTKELKKIFELNPINPATGFYRVNTVFDEVAKVINKRQLDNEKKPNRSEARQSFYNDAETELNKIIKPK